MDGTRHNANLLNRRLFRRGPGRRVADLVTLKFEDRPKGQMGLLGDAIVEVRADESSSLQ